MSLVESDPCQGNCTQCSLCDNTVPVKREDLEAILKMTVCDEIRAIVGRYLNGTA